MKRDVLRNEDEPSVYSTIKEIHRRDAWIKAPYYISVI